SRSGEPQAAHFAETKRVTNCAASALPKTRQSKIRLEFPSKASTNRSRTRAPLASIFLLDVPAHTRVRARARLPRRRSAKGADRKSTRLNSSHVSISYAVFCLK